MKTEKQYAPKLDPSEQSQNPARYIPDDSYISARDLIKRVDPRRNGPATYPQHKAVDHLLLTTLERLDLTKYQLGKILGVKHQSHVYQWFNGYRRPGPLYLSRLCHVLLMGYEPNGLPINLISSIDWELSEIRWRSGEITQDDHYFPGWDVQRAKKGVPHLTGGVKFDRALHELPEQRVSPEHSDSSF